jgi:DNA polymerase III epsilon subunit-like protein
MGHDVKVPHEELLEQSPVFRTRPPEKRALILDAVRVLHRYPDGLSIAALEREIAGSGRHPPDWLIRELERTVAACGVFRLAASGRFGLVSVSALETPLADVPVAVMDLEATGGRPPLHRLIEVALIRREPDGTESWFESLADPMRPLPWYVTKITGLSPRKIREAPPVDQVVEELLPMLEGALLVFHGSASDMELLNYEVFRRSGTLLDNPVMCTICLTRELLPELSTMGLDRVAAHLGIEMATQHRAMDDALATLQLLHRFAERFTEIDMTYLVDAAFFQGALPVPPFIATNLSVELLNGLPAGPGAFVLRDGSRRILDASVTDDLKRSMAALFFPARPLDARGKQVARNARYLDYRPALDLPSASEALTFLLSGAPGPPPAVPRRARAGPEGPPAPPRRAR